MQYSNIRELCIAMDLFTIPLSATEIRLRGKDLVH